MNKQMLPGLNGLRAIAACHILITHTYQIAGNLKDSSAEQIANRVFYLGPDMVNLFFVISGFIITLLLLKERSNTNGINLKTFYTKRIGRIFPLYFLILIIVYILSNYTSIYAPFGSLTSGSLWVIGLFLVTINVYFGAPMSALPHYWSLSVEEQFYLFWPLLLKKFNVKVVCFCVIVLMLLSRNGAAFFSHRNSESALWYNLNTYLVASKFSSMAIGAFAAYLFITKDQRLRFLKNTILVSTILGMFIASFFLRCYIPYIHSELFAVFYALVILVAVQKKHFLLDSKAFSSIGKVSYGIYMYQWPLIPVIILVAKKFQIYESLAMYNFIPLVIVCFGLTYLLAYISYHGFEKRFIDLSHRTEKVASPQKVYA